ncbi:MAG: gluconokinase [Terriglobia bacterium]
MTTEAAIAAKDGSGPFVATLDVGSSSVRTMLFDARAREVDGMGTQLSYEASTTPDGGVEVDAGRLVDLVVECLTTLHEQIRARQLKASAVACCTFWHNVLGVGSGDRPVTPVLHPFDTRAVGAAAELAKKIDDRVQHARTGCVLHASYLPAKLLWLVETQPDVFRSAKRWMSFGEFLYLKLFGRAVASTSMVSGSGLWDQNENRYDAEILGALPVDAGQLAPVDEMDQPLNGLRAEYAARWPQFDAVPWYPAWGDGACSNVGSDCHSPDRFALMVGTSGAMRTVSESQRIEIPASLWCYRVDRRRYVLGGALSNGGEVYAWMKRVLALPGDPEVESQLAALEPGEHGLTVLPLFAGERTPHWRADARAAITGLSAGTRPVEILRASLEAVALRFRVLYDLMTARFGVPREVIASGGALLRSPVWTQMMADALAQQVTECVESEGSSRGVALLSLEQLGVIRHARELPGRMGRVFDPIPAHGQIYQAQLQRQERLYAKLYGER